MASAKIQIIKPRALNSGDTVAIVAPAGPIQRNLLDAGVLALFRLGYKPVYLDSIFDSEMFFAGTAERRVKELQEMFARPEVKAIICARGGYGCNYLLERLNLEIIRKNPKIFVGYSDSTCLLTWLHDQTGLVTFHGPMVTRDFDDAADMLHLASWKNALEGRSHWEVAAAAGPREEEGVQALVPGAGEGMLYGGCLSILVASLGTPYEIQTDGKILFIEDINEKPHRIDRMLMQLKLAGKFRGVRGVVFGEMVNCEPEHDHDFTLEQVIQRVFGDLKIPIAYGLRSGHVTKQNITLPLGVQASLHVDSGVRLSIAEAATS